MAKANTVWKAYGNNPIEKLSPRLWRVEAGLPGLPMRRIMAIAKRSDGGLVIHNGIVVDEPTIKAIEAWGPIKEIVVPNGWHRLDAKVFHDRYPDARIVGPAGARSKIEDVVPLHATYGDRAPDANVELQYLDGLNEAEGVMVVKDEGGTSLIFTDAVFNMPHLHGIKGFVLKHITGSSGGPKVSNLMRWFVVKDKAAYRANLERLAAIPDLRRILVAHHETIETDPRGALRKIAATI